MQLQPFPALFSLALLFAPLAAQEMPAPQAEHQSLATRAGTWDAVIESTDMAGKPSKSNGVSELRASLGGFWVIEDFTADFGGMPFQGHGVLGYDPTKRRFVQSWADSMSPMLMTFEGGFDKAGKVLTMTGRGPGMDDKLVDMRNVTTWVDANTTTFEMFSPGADGKDERKLKITYTRRGAGKAVEASGKK